MGEYQVIRFYADSDLEEEIIATGLTLAEAQAMTDDPETSSKTATTAEALERTAMFGPWFDGYRSMWEADIDEFDFSEVES